jgi:reductive dehalogenase
VVTTKIEIKRYDERDNVQGRHELVPESPEWEEYYKAHPERKEADLAQHDLPGGLGVGAPADIKAFVAMMSLLRQLGDENMVDGPVESERVEMTPERATEKMKGFGKHLGSAVVRVGPLNQAYVYSHKGRTYHRHGEGEPKVGTPIELPHKNAIVMIEGLDTKILKGAPKKQVILEVFRAYSKLGHMAVILARYIRSLGYPARAHIVTNYQLIVPPLAIDAGVGELGRHGVLISKEFGSAMKMSVVTTDLPMVHDKKPNLGVEDFCRHCKICAENCPSGAISYGEKQVVRGVARYPFKAEACFKIWNETGTDCGVCIGSCPFSKPPSLHHNFGLWLSSKGGKFPGVFLTFMERLIYGVHSPGDHPHPKWMEEPPPVWEKYRFGRRK